MAEGLWHVTEFVDFPFDENDKKVSYDMLFSAWLVESITRPASE